MAGFDVHADPDGPGYLLDCQSDLLSHIDTRLVLPLMPAGTASAAFPRLNPVFEISGLQHAMLTQAAAAVPTGLLGRPVPSLRAAEITINNAWDMLLTGI